MSWQIRKLHNRININLLRDYLSKVESDFSYLKWEANTNLAKVDSGVGGHILDNVYGYGVESNLADISLPCPPYNISKEKREYRDTVLVFGIICQLKEMFPNSHQYSIAAHPPKTFINFHTDSDHSLKIHIPIYTNDSALFCFEDNSYTMPADGSMYLVNTDLLHSTVNNGNSTRIHLFFKIPMSTANSLVYESINIEPALT